MKQCANHFGNIGLMCVLALGLGGLADIADAKAPVPAPKVFHIPQADQEKESGDFVVKIEPEYRTRVVHINPLDLSGTQTRKMAWADQRLRLDLTMARVGQAAIFVQADVLDGVLFGDNGEAFQSPEPTSGVNIASKRANSAGWQVGLLPGGGRLDIDGYGPVLTPIEPIAINYAYGEIALPFGLLRVGRQPLSNLGTISLHDGRSGRNRWGTEFYHQSVDRVVFGTKISELVGLLSEDDYTVDTRTDRGVFLGLVYDWLVEDDVQVSSDDLQGVAAQIRVLYPEFEFLGATWRNFRMLATVTYRWDERFETGVYALPFHLSFDVDEWLSLSTTVAYIGGETKEISAGLADLSGRPAVLQRMSALGAQVTLDFHVGPVTLVADFGYASGDADPRANTAHTTFSWPRDHNFGLLLFEHVLAFQSARSVAVGIENLKDNPDAETFPLGEIATEGRITNTIGLFPQIFVDLWDSLRFKAGALFAFSDTDIVDPVQTNLAWDGERIDDDAVNFYGGKPGRYWGTEFDLGVEWYYKDFMAVVVEAAYLLPGAGLRDENNDAVPSFMVEGRLTLRL